MDWMKENPDLKQKIKAEAYNLGFVLCGFSVAETPAGFERYLRWLEAGCHAGMTYLVRPNAITAREDPGKLLEDCKTVISLGMAYQPQFPITEAMGSALNGRIAFFATYADYHEVMRDALSRLLERIEELSGNGHFLAVDTTPILEKDFAVSAGLGSIGRNSLLIHPRFGSWLLLGEILTTMSFEGDEGFLMSDCQDCQRCVMACPTKAIRSDRSIDANRCLSYLTIENRGNIPESYRELMGNRIFGCDACQTACPKNRHLDSFPSPSFQESLIEPNQDLFTAMRLSETEFKARFANTPVLRCAYAGWKRNIAIALGNSGEEKAIGLLEEAFSLESNPIVRESITWALNRLVRTIRSC